MTRPRGGNNRGMRFPGVPDRQKIEMVQGPGGIALPKHVAQQQNMKPSEIRCLPVAWGGWPAKEDYISEIADEPMAVAAYRPGSQRLLTAESISVAIYVRAAVDVKRGQWCSILMPSSGFVVAPPPAQVVMMLYMTGNQLCMPLADIPAEWYGWAWCSGVRPDYLENTDG